MELDDGNTQDIDEDLYSRQIAVYGLQTMRRLFASNVLVSGMQGLGAEIAKNLILAGIKSITLHDEGTVDWWDLSGNFVLSENDIGMNRAEACVKKLQELNYAVLVNNLPGKLTKEQLSNFQAVVFTASDLKTAIEFNHYCRNHQPCISFIKADINGLFGNVFCDFGPEFTVADVDGEEPHTGIIADISNDREALICCVKDEKLQFQDGDFVLFSEIHGMIELNDGKPKRIKECSPYSFRIEKDTTNFTQYVKGGCVTQVKQPKVLNFRPLQETLTNPKEFLLSDFSKPDHPPVLHLAFQALDEFLCQVGRFPIAGSEDDVQKFTSIAVIINEKCGDQKLQDIKPELLSDFAHGARADLSPMATMFGGIAAQEIVKACSGMFHPIFQLFYFDSIESLPKTVPNPRYREPFDTRYDAQISVFGYNFQTKLENTRAFIVGCGSLGCEFVKNLALMGVSCGTDGKLIVTDEDVIKKSNLSNQLLFTEGDIRKAKSIIAASKAKYINPDLQIKALQHRVGPETENVFDITFWEDQNVVISAVDNTDSRIYVDQRCVLYRKPLLESGTMGAKCSTQMVIPDFTEHYGASTDPLEKQVPECNLKNFPYNINHCLKWALKEFEDLIEKPLHEVNTYISYPLSYTSALRKTRNSKSLEIILNCLEMERCDTFQDCISWARLKFEDCFTNQVKELILKYPEDLKTESGTSFWSPPKRFPRPLAFNHSDQSHICFVLSASILRAEIFGISIPEWVNDSEKISEAVDRVIVPDFQPNQHDISISMKIDTDATSYIDQLIQKIEQCTQSLPSCIRLKHTHFYKDDNNSYETDFIAGLANMRARNYNIPEVDKLTAKVIAGRIIPKISTCTAMATGLVCLELYKVIDEDHFGEDYRNTFANLALPFFSMAEPLPPKKNYNFRHDSQL